MLVKRVNQRMSCCSTSSAATQTATNLGALFIIPLNTTHDGDLVDVVASEADIRLAHFSVIPDESPRTDAQQTSVPVLALGPISLTRRCGTTERL